MRIDPLDSANEGKPLIVITINPEHVEAKGCMIISGQVRMIHATIAHVYASPEHRYCSDGYPVQSWIDSRAEFFDREFSDWRIRLQQLADRPTQI